MKDREPLVDAASIATSRGATAKTDKIDGRPVASVAGLQAREPECAHGGCASPEAETAEDLP